MKLRAVGMWLNLLVASVLMLAVWVLLVWVGSRPALKALIDLSPQQRCTVDPVTAELLHGLAEQSISVEFHMFFEPAGGAPQDLFQQQRQRILARLRELTEMLLRQYAFLGGDSVKVENHQPYGDITRYREVAQQFAVTQTDVVVVAVRQSGRPPRHRLLSLEGDLGVVDIPQGKAGPVPKASVPVLKNYKGEEALSSALKSLLVQGTPVVYLLDSYSQDVDVHGAVGTGYLQLTQMLTSLGFEWRVLDLRTGVVPKDATVITVLEPRREFTDSEVRVLYDYVRHGGRLFLNYSYSGDAQWDISGGELGKLLGYEIGSRPVYHLIVDPRYGDRVRGLDGDPRVSKLDLQMNPNHPITLRLARSLQGLQVDAARELMLAEPAPKGLRPDVLLSSGPQGWLAHPDATGRPDTHAPQAQSAFRPYTVGAVIDVDGVAGADGRVQNGVVVVVSGIFCNNLGMPVNGNLAANIFNYLAERRVLLDIRGSSYVARHLQLVPQQLERISWFLIVLVPGSFLALGLFVFWRRRDR